MKRIGKIIICFIFVFWLLSNINCLVAATVVEEGECGANGPEVTWIFDDDDVLTISGNGMMKDYLISESKPWDSFVTLKKVVIKKGVTHIGEGAFYANHLSEVEIEDGIESIGDYCFGNCWSLDYVCVPNSVIRLSNAFPNSTLLICDDLCATTNNIKKTDYMTKYGVTGNAGENLTYTFNPFTGEMCFSGSGKFYSDFKFDYSKFVKKANFENCLVEDIPSFNGHDYEKLSSVILPDGLKSIGNSAFRFCYKLNSINIPDSVTSIDYFAFDNCANLTDIIIPEGVTNIAGNTFSNCNSLTNVVIPKSVTYIGSHSFSKCANLQKCYIMSEDKINIASTAFFDDTVQIYGHSILKDIIEGWNCSAVSYESLCDIGKHLIKEDLEISATCTLGGKTEGSHCSDCGTIIVAQLDIPAKGHTEVKDDAIAPTCILEGKTEGSHCSICNTVIIEQKDINALGHKFSNYITNNDATCTNDYTLTALCDNGCNTRDTKKEIGTATGHVWDKGVVIKEATTNSEGVKIYTCTACKETIKESIPKLVVVEKKNQKIRVVTSKKISLKSLKKKSQSYKLLAKATSEKKVKYKLIKGDRNIKFSAASGKVTVKKGTKKGTYKIKVKMMVDGNSEYNKYSATKTFLIKVK